MAPRIPRRFESIGSRPARGHEVVSNGEDAPDDGIEFDPKRDISLNEWEAMKEKLKTFRAIPGKGLYEVRDHIYEWAKFADMASNLLILFPAREGELGVDDLAFDRMKQLLEKERSNQHWKEFAQLAVDMIQLYPQRVEELGLNEKTYRMLRRRIGPWESREHAPDSIVIEIVINLLVIFPELSRELNVGGGRWFNGLKSQLEKNRGKSWLYFGALASFISLLFPDRKAELRVDREAWENIRREFELLRTKDLGTFSRAAYNLMILAAERAEITSDGQIKITPKKPKLDVKASSPLPLTSMI